MWNGPRCTLKTENNLEWIFHFAKVENPCEPYSNRFRFALKAGKCGMDLASQKIENACGNL